MNFFDWTQHGEMPDFLVWFYTCHGCEINHVRYALQHPDRYQVEWLEWEELRKKEYADDGGEWTR